MVIEIGTEMYIEIPESARIVDEEQVKSILEGMLKCRKIEVGIPEDLIRKPKDVSGLSNSKTASLAGINKEKVNRIIVSRSSIQ